MKRRVQLVEDKDSLLKKMHTAAYQLYWSYSAPQSKQMILD